MASSSGNQVQYGVFVGPLRCHDVLPLELARRVYWLMTCAGFSTEHIDTIGVNTHKGFARVGLFEIDYENKVVQRCGNYKYLMSIYDMYKLTTHPQYFKVIRLQPYTDEFMSLNSFWRQVVNNIHSHTYQAIFDPRLDDRSATLKQTQAQAKPPEQVHAATEVTSSFTSLSRVLTDMNEDKPVMISEKTSTTVIEPCFFPYRRFYLASETPQWPEKNVVFLKEDPLLDSMRCFRNMLAKYVCAFLNSEDGVIYFGVNASGRVVGFYIDHKSEDMLALDIDYVMKAIQPDVPISAYHVTFAKIINATGHVEPNCVVLEVRVQGLMPAEFKYTYCGDVYLWTDNELQKLNDYAKRRGAQLQNNSGCCSQRGGSGHDSRGGTTNVNKGGARQGNSGTSRESPKQGGQSGGNKGSAKRGGRGGGGRGGGARKGNTSRKYGYHIGGN